ncbi:class I SAM-dependent methyltransferase [Sorangium sp. So ce1099]|uniref:class I SAM-dependent methyltransferase n=1 Tax=Sorangium sp. So ce1099 TaxID=3133331 RepID=UPI003F602DF8
MDAAALSPNERFLLDFHRSHAGATSEFFGPARAPEGGDSYDRLAALVPAGGDAVVLDLGCGDGLLLERIRQRRGSGAGLIGLDMSADELAAAARRLGPEVLLLNERAQAISLPPASVDVVLSHMALMLMGDPASVVAEIHRVLQPGGVFSAIVDGGPAPSDDGGPAPSDGFACFVESLRRTMRAAGRQPLQLVHPTFASQQALLAHLGEAAGFSDARVKELAVSRREPPSRLWELMLLTYDMAYLSPGEVERVRRDFLDAVEALRDAEGMVACSIGLRQFTARKQG